MSEKKNSDIIKQEDHAKVEKYSTFEEFNENTLRVRRNLLIFSVIALFYKLSGATLTDKFSLLGMEFEHINPEMIDLFLLCIVGYHFVHFIWLAYEHSHHHIISYMATFEFEDEKVSSFTSVKKIVEKMKEKNEQLKIKNSEVHEKNLEQMKKRYEQQKKEYEQLKIFDEEFEKLRLELGTDEEFEKLRLELGALENFIKESAIKLEESAIMYEALKSKIKELESFKKEAEDQFIKINKWRYFLIETSFPSLIGIFAVFVLVL
jgi:hypothetical protein